MFGELSPRESPAYRSRRRIVILSEGEIVSFIAWWVDNPLTYAKDQAKMQVNWYKERGVEVSRTVVDFDNCVFFKFTTKNS